MMAFVDMNRTEAAGTLFLRRMPEKNAARTIKPICHTPDTVQPRDLQEEDGSILHKT